MRERLSEAETEISRLRESLAGKEGEVTQLRALLNLNQEVNSQLGQNVERLQTLLSTMRFS